MIFSIEIGENTDFLDANEFQDKFEYEPYIIALQVEFSY